MAAAEENDAPWIPAICVVGFHHARGPEIETWLGVPEGTDPAIDNDWGFLPFMALSDGAHALEEDFSYFTLRRKATMALSATSLFGMSCTRQLNSKELIERPADVTRSTVQKSVVVVARSPHVFTAWREKLSLVTRAWFLQRDFTKTTILKDFQENLAETELNTSDEARDHYVGISLREFVHEFKHQALVMFKCCLLQPKMLFFSSRCERLCMIQFALISLIPGLITALQDCADPELDRVASTAEPATSLKSSDRQSLLAYVGLPIQLFGKGSLFGPYTPLQQLDVLADFDTKSYMVGSTNSLLLQQKDRYSDIIVNLDDSTVTCTSPSLRNALVLTHADRRWIDLIFGDVTADWDPVNPSRPRNLGFKGSEEYIRILFEQYVIALLSSVKFHLYFNSLPSEKRSLASFNYEIDPSSDFGDAWIETWKQTPAFAIWNRLTDAHLFDVVDPRHPTAGGFSVDDFNRRLAQELQDLHLDERFATSKEALSKSLAHGQKKVSAAINNIWADLEARRAASRQKSPSRPEGAGKDVEDVQEKDAEGRPLPDPESASNLSAPVASTAPVTSTLTPGPDRAHAASFQAPDLTQAQAALGAAGQRASSYISSLSATPTGQKAGTYLTTSQKTAGQYGQKAGAYFNSWGSWASEKRKGWNVKKEEDPPTPPPQMGGSDKVTRGAMAFEAMLGGPPRTPRTPMPETPKREEADTSETQKEPEAAPSEAARAGNETITPKASKQTDENERPEPADDAPTSPTSPKSPKGPKSPRKSPRKSVMGSDGIGRLDA